MLIQLDIGEFGWLMAFLGFMFGVLVSIAVYWISQSQPVDDEQAQQSGGKERG